MFLCSTKNACGHPLNPSDHVLAGAFDLLPSQPCSQNNVLNPVVQPQPPSAVVAPLIEAVDHLPPHSGAAPPNAGVIIVAHHPQVAPPPGGVGVVLAPPATPNGGDGAVGGAAPAPEVPPSDVTAPRGTFAHLRAQAARMATQRQMAAVAVGGNCIPTVWPVGMHSVTSPESSNASNPKYP